VTDVGTYLKYGRDIRFSADRMALIVAARAICEEYESTGYALSLRQLYYQFVARGMIGNTQANYNILGNAVSDGRMAGLISWTAIEDRGRNLRGIHTYNHPADAVNQLKGKYSIDKWEDQPMRPEVWVEKEALSSLVAHACNPHQVNYFATKGYNSQSEMWNAAQRFGGYVRKGQRPVIIHLGDHDPSGIDMTRDNRERLEEFMGVPVMVIRIALNYDQVQKFNPPPNPAKMTDSRATKYVDEFGATSWEVDALKPEYLVQLIEDTIMKFKDPAKFDAKLGEEAEHLQEFDDFTENYRSE
jgi:hypothetical protein